MPKQIIAAGGLVTNAQGEILWIFRRGFWDLPKGKLDEGETIQSCAIREVEEETGIQNIKLHELLKRTYWFNMTIADMQKGIPQSAEDIEKIEWHSLATAKHCLEQTYPTILEVIEAYRLKINA